MRLICQTRDPNILLNRQIEQILIRFLFQEQTTNMYLLGSESAQSAHEGAIYLFCKIVYAVRALESTQCHSAEFLYLSKHYKG